MEILKINEKLTKNINDEVKLNMLYKNDNDLTFKKFFINSILDYNSNYKLDGGYVDGTVKSSVVFNNFLIQHYDNYYKINEIMQLFHKKLFRNIKNDIKNKINILYIKHDDAKEFYMIISNKSNKRLLKKFDKNKIIKNGIHYEFIIDILKGYTDELMDLIYEDSVYILLNNKDDLIEFIFTLMKKYKYEIINCNFFGYKKLEESNSSNFIFERNLYNENDILKNMDSISYKDIINKNKEKIEFVSEKEFKKVSVRDSFK